SGVDRSERTRGIAVVEDLALQKVATLDAKRKAIGIEIILNPFLADLESLDIRLDQPLLSAKLLADQLFDHRELDLEKRNESADIGYVREKRTLTSIGEFGVRELHQRYRDQFDIRTVKAVRQGL